MYWDTGDYRRALTLRMIAYSERVAGIFCGRKRAVAQYRIDLVPASRGVPSGRERMTLAPGGGGSLLAVVVRIGLGALPLTELVGVIWLWAPGVQ